MNDDQFWSFLGKLSLLIGGIVGLIKIVEWITSPKGRLNASIQAVPFLLPIPQENAPKVVAGYERLYIAVVRNSGSKPCEQVTLILPHALIAKIGRVGTDVEYRELKDGIIELGTIKPKEAIRLRAWCRWWSEDWEDLRLSHASGVGRISVRADAPKFFHELELIFPHVFKGIMVALISFAVGFMLNQAVLKYLEHRPASPPKTTMSFTTNWPPSQVTNNIPQQQH